MKFEWDEQKNQLNQKKHGVSFEEAKNVFDDALHIAKLDHRFSYFEERWITLVRHKKAIFWWSSTCFFPMKGRRLFASSPQDLLTQERRNIMRTIEQRAELDNFELADDYDFSGGIRGRFYQSKKVTATVELDNDVLLFIKKKAQEKHMDYQTLLNSLLRDYMTTQ
jgi:uncharacterized DUF497 family protein/predicted DNA binding CopG/RHH family protein